jgi:CheY-like chemotaxis protein
MVLYVEDEFEDRELMLKAVARAKAKFELRLAKDYRGSVEYLSHQGFYEDREQFRLPDLVLLDYSLKGGKAIDLLVWIRARPEIATLPVLILSDNAADHVVAECYARGANLFIEKRGARKSLEDLVRSLDACLSTFPVQLKPLKKFALRPELARQHLRETMRESLETRATIEKEEGKLTQPIDLTGADQRNLEREFEFIPPDQMLPRPHNGIREATVYIENRQTGEFVTSKGKWIADRRSAFSFATPLEALAYCERNGLADCDILTENGHPTLDVRIPYRPASDEL